MTQATAPNGGAQTVAESVDDKRTLMAMGERGLELRTSDDLIATARNWFRTNFNPVTNDKRKFETVEDVYAVILAGRKFGMEPADAMQMFCTIKGRLCMAVEGMEAIVKKSPLFCWSSYKEWTTGKRGEDDYTWHCQMRRNVEGAEPFECTYSVAQAKEAGLWQRQSGGGASMPWATYSDDMGSKMPRKRCMKRVYTDLLFGIESAEEMQIAALTSMWDMDATNKAVEAQAEPASRTDSLVGRLKGKTSKTKNPTGAPKNAENRAESTENAERNRTNTPKTAPTGSKTAIETRGNQPETDLAGSKTHSSNTEKPRSEAKNEGGTGPSQAKSPPGRASHEKTLQADSNHGSDVSAVRERVYNEIGKLFDGFPTHVQAKALELCPELDAPDMDLIMMNRLNEIVDTLRDLSS